MLALSLAVSHITFSHFAFAQGAAGFKVTGEVERADGWITAKAAARVMVALPAEKNRLTIRGKAGSNRSGLSFTLRDAGGGVTNYSVKALPQQVPAGESYPDGTIELAWQGGRTYIAIRPNMASYNAARQKELAAVWETFPSASGTPWALEFRREAGGTQLWVNGQFVQPLPITTAFASAEFRLQEGAALQSVVADDAPPAEMLALPTATYAKPGTMAEAEITLAPDAALPKELALPAKAGAGSIAVDGLGRIIGSAADDLVSHAWRRSPLHALQEVRIFDVPLATYSHASFLCAAEGDPAKVPAFTARVTRYGTSRGDAMADTTVTLPGAGQTPGAGTRRVGEVAFGAGAARKTVPLWLVRVPLKNGQIQDLLAGISDEPTPFRSQRYVDFEILDPVPGVESAERFPPPMDGEVRTYTPGAERSSVHIFAAALETSPAALKVTMNLPVQVAYAAEKPEWRAEVSARLPGTYNVLWDFADVDGKTVASGRKTVALTAAKSTETVTVPVTAGTGWYATRFQLSNAKGEELTDHRSAFVVLPPDTRKAGFESPYGTWWFSNSHGGQPDFDRVGPLLQKAGLRHTTLPESLPESITGKMGVTHWAVRWRPLKTGTVAEQVAAHEELIRKSLELWPGVDKMLVWHESGDGAAPFPSELWGEPAVPSAESEKYWKTRLEFITPLAQMVRAKFPKLKMQYGNDGSSVNLIGALMRHKFPRQYIDSIASEDIGQTMSPEWPMTGSVQSTWYLRETARKLGYGDVPVTACFEWINRRSATLGLEQQAQWYARDGLHAQAYGFSSIALGTIHDAGNGYFHTIWGAGGLTRRFPTMEPKPAYAALAAQTRLLDGARFEREVPTGMLSLYALEFRRGAEWVYALWTPRAARGAQLSFPAGTRLTLADLYGREKAATAPTVPVILTPGVQYLVSSARLAGFKAGPFVAPEPRGKATLVDAMDKAANWTQIVDVRRYEHKQNLPHLKSGNFTLREVNDAEMGPCLELELKPEGDQWMGVQEFAVLQLAKPVAPAGEGDSVGVWVKGNGGNGDIDFFVLNEGQKVPFLTQNVRTSWTGLPAVNFDGWYFLQRPMTGDPRWKKGFPVGLFVKMPRQTIHLTEAQKVPELKLRFKGLSLVVGGE